MYVQVQTCMIRHIHGYEDVLEHTLNYTAMSREDWTLTTGAAVYIYRLLQIGSL